MGSYTWGNAVSGCFVPGLLPSISFTRQGSINARNAFEQGLSDRWKALQSRYRIIRHSTQSNLDHPDLLHEEDNF
jgi:hypothetical protein